MTGDAAGFTIGPVTVELSAVVSGRPIITVKVGDAEVVYIASTPSGRRAYVTVTERGRTRVQASVYVGGRWWQSGGG